MVLHVQAVRHLERYQLCIEFDNAVTKRPSRLLTIPSNSAWERQWTGAEVEWLIGSAPVYHRQR